MSEIAEVERFVRWLALLEERTDATGNVARAVRDRPQQGRDSPWPTFDAVRTHFRFYGPRVEPSELEQAITEFRAT